MPATLTAAALTVAADPVSRPVSAHAAAVTAFGVVAAALRDQAPYEQLLRVAARELAGLLGVPRCLAFDLHEPSGTYLGRVAHGADEGLARRLTCGLPSDRLTRELVATRAPVVAERARTDERTVRSAMRDWDVHSVAGVPVVDRDVVVVVFFLDAPGRPHRFESGDIERARVFADLVAFALVQGRLADEARARTAATADEAEALRRAMVVDERVWAAAADGASEVEVAQLLSDLLGLPCAVLDGELRRIAAATPKSGSGRGQMPDLAGLAIRRDAELTAALDAIPGGGVGVVGPFFEHGARLRLVVARSPAIGRDGRTILLAEDGRSLQRLDLVVARRCAASLAVQVRMATHGAPCVAGRELRSAALADLLAASDGNQRLPSAPSLGLGAGIPAALCLFAHHRTLPAHDVAAAALEDALPGVTVTSAATASGVVVLVAGAETTAIRAAVRDVGEAGPREGGLVVAVCALGAEASAANVYADLRETVACALALTDDRRGVTVLAADELGPVRALLTAAGRAGCERFATRVLSGLLDPAAAPLLATLRRLAEHAWTIRDAAEALGVHDNTVRYRIGRIEEATGLAVRTDARAQMSVQLALLVLDLTRGPDGSA